MTNSPLSGVGGGGAYIDRTVDKMSFVIRSVASLSVDRQNHARARARPVPFCVKGVKLLKAQD